MSANRGKYGEGKVQEYLNVLKATKAAFTFNRIADAHSAKGNMSTQQAGDFQWFVKYDEVIPWTDGTGAPMYYTRNGLIEVKQTEHAFRLPFNNFGSDQVGRAVIRQMAGSEAIVLICHHKDGERGALWRNIPLDFFRERPGPKFGSWDLSQFPTYPSVKDALQEHLA